MNLDQLSSYLNTLFVIIALLSAAFGIQNRETIKTLRETNKDLVDRISVLEGSDERKTKELEELRKENQVLRTVISGEARLNAIETAIETHHTSATAYWDIVFKKLDALLEKATTLVNKCENSL